MREIVREWVKKGDSDFIAAKTLAPQKGVENQTGFHCQQAIEKWLKAYLIKQGEELRKIHDLTALVIDCEKYDPTFQELEPLVEGITETLQLNSVTPAKARLRKKCRMLLIKLSKSEKS